MTLISELNANGKTSYQTFLNFVWLAKIFEIRLPILNVNTISTRVSNRIRWNCIEFAHISAIFLSSNDNLLKTHDSIQQERFNQLLTECKPKQDAGKLTFDFSDVSLTKAENHF